MYPYVALIFLAIPIAEIYLLIQVGTIIGALPTILLIILTAIIGVRLLRQQGLSTLMKAQQKMQSGALPADEMIEGIALIIAGAFLLTPGFFTDFAGFLLLIPATRQKIVRLFVSQAATRFKGSIHTSTHQARQNPFEQSPHSTNTRKGEVIEGVKYHKEED